MTDHALDVINLACKRSSTCFPAVEILASYRDGIDPIVPMLLNGGLKCGLLRAVVLPVLSPDTDKDFGARTDGCWNSVGESTVVATCVDTDVGKVLSEALELVERGVPLVFGFPGAVRVGISDVEAFVECCSGGQCCCESSDDSKEAHIASRYGWPIRYSPWHTTLSYIRKSLWSG